MKCSVVLFAACLFGSVCLFSPLGLFAQSTAPILRPITHAPVATGLNSASREAPPAAAQQDALRSRAATSVDPRLAPFYHGVASGNPTADGVILWTRVTADAPSDIVSVDWELATDTAFSTVLQSGNVSTDSVRDFTVQINVTGLDDGQTYYYRFEALGQMSIIGRTRTADQNADNLKFAVVSCNSYPQGYFNAFGRIAERNDLDAVVHLGDFIYEYDEDTAGAPSDGMRGELEPEHEILALGDYRQRYAWYRLDPDLRRAMQQHPFIFIWDDHETANDSWVGGAENHSPLTEGDWEGRKSRALRAYFEWVPVPSNPDNRIYRRLDYGSLAQWHMLDTRLEGRVEQVPDFMDPSLWDPSRTLLGEAQLAWLSEGLTTSPAQWKLVGNQVVFSPLILENFESIYPGAQNTYLDVWNGYPAERTRLLDSISAAGINDIVFCTGDVHIALAFDVPYWDGDTLLYDPATGDGSKAVEFVTTSISSNNFDEIIGIGLSNLVEGLFIAENPHGAFNEFDRHGYLVLDLTTARAQADFFFVESKLEPNPNENFARGFFTLSGENRLQQASAQAPPKANQEDPAPDPTASTTGLSGPEASSLYTWNVYPNPPSAGRLTVAFSTLIDGPVEVYLTDIQGRIGRQLYSGHVPAGNWELDLFLPPGNAAGKRLLTLQNSRDNRSQLITLP